MKRTVFVALGMVCVAAWSLHGEEPAKPGRQPASFASVLIRSAQSGAWSAPNTWEGGKVPAAGAKVQIRTGHTVTYDIGSGPVIRSIHVAGTLTFACDRDTRLEVGLIKIQPGDDASEDGFNCDAHLAKLDPSIPWPALEVGTPNDPIPAEHTATIRLVAVEGLDPDSCPAIVCCGGRMDLHGAPLSCSWVKLGATVNAGRAGKPTRVSAPGDIEVKLGDSVTGWRVGDRIVVTTTTSRSRVNQRETLRPRTNINGAYTPKTPPAYTEERTIKAIEGDRLTVDRPLDYYHQGEGDYRGEVANLSRNVVIESADPAKARGHTMYHKHSSGSISYAEFRHLGKEGLLGKYPIHIHLAGDTMRGSYVLGASIWDSGNRWVTVHGTSYFIIRDCVGYQSVGHGYFLEDGSEVFNVFDRNLAVQAFAGKPLPEQFLPFDHNDGAGFWWANSQNTFTRNVAVECDRYGFRFEATPTGDFDLRRPVLQPDGTLEPVDIRTLPFVRFEGNEAHDQLFGINLGGLGGDFFKGGVDGVVPNFGSPFLLKSTRIWNTHWAFAPHTRYAVDDLDIADSTYGLFLPAYDAEVQPPFFGLQPGATTDWGRVTFHRTQVAVRLSDVKPRYFGDPFDLMEFARDTLPPATVITHIRRTKEGDLLVRGTTSENQTVKRVLVNGREAKATAPNFAEWEIALDVVDREIKLTAYAVDDSGNVELRPHRLLVRQPSDNGRAAAQPEMVQALLTSSPEEKAGENVASSTVSGRSPSDSNRRNGDRPLSDADALQGTWQMVSQQRAGRATARPKNMTWIIEGDTITLIVTRGEEENLKTKGPAEKGEVKGGKPSGKGQGLRMTFRLDATKSPRQFDIYGLRKSMSLGIYKLDGDELTVCMGPTQPYFGFGGIPPSFDKQAKSVEGTRPTAISPDTGTVIVLKRIRE